MGLSAGSRLGPYEIVSPVGAGGMGEVYRARDTRLDRTVAIKVLNSSLVATPELRARFEREAKVISQLQHPHICVLHDIGSDNGTDFLVMEFLEGESLADRLRRGPLRVDELLKIAIQIADALDKAHRAGIVHRDLKPGNVMLTRAGAKLLDFGLARPAGAMTAGAPSSGSVFSAALTESSPVSPLSSVGTVIGTVQYMSPEQISGGAADARSDIFALGLVLYEMATGKSNSEVGKPDVWVYGMARKVRTRLTFAAGVNANASWPPDGKSVAFVSNRGGQFHIYEKAADGTGKATPLLVDDAAEFFPSWSADGRYIAFQRSSGVRESSANGPASGEIWGMPLTGDQKPFPVVQTDGSFNAIQPGLSPDGKWLAYVSDESGQQEIYIVPFPHGNGRWQVSSAGGEWPCWAHDGKELFYRSLDNKLMSAKIAEQDASLVIGNVEPLFQMNPAAGVLGSGYDVSADGKRFIVTTEDLQQQAAPLTLVVNWPALLKK